METSAQSVVQKLRRPDSVKNHGRRSSPPPELPTDANIGPLVARVKQSSVIFGNGKLKLLQGYDFHYQRGHPFSVGCRSTSHGLSGHALKRHGVIFQLTRQKFDLPNPIEFRNCEAWDLHCGTLRFSEQKHSRTGTAKSNADNPTLPSEREEARQQWTHALSKWLVQAVNHSRANQIGSSHCKSGG